MELLSEALLDGADQQRFQYTENKWCLIERFNASPTEFILVDSSSIDVPPWLGKVSRNALHKDSGSNEQSRPCSSLLCCFQQDRPKHHSGQEDKLPFRSAGALRQVFAALGLPLTYMQISDGFMGIVHGTATPAPSTQNATYHFVAHCNTKQGDWALTVAHDVRNGATSAFWSVERTVESKELLETLSQLREYACHPMLIPCIMFATVLRASTRRRLYIKEKIRTMEESANACFRAAASMYEGEESSLSERLQSLFRLLHQCRHEQTSREGRYDFWRSFHEALQDGFAYAESHVRHGLALDDRFAAAHSELSAWAALTWQKLRSLKARDIDHYSRVDNVSVMLHSITQRLDSRAQASVAIAARRDSQDMKFIALLGSIFLPASLVAVSLALLWELHNGL
ncbi:hypothetical protein Tdes44962_MAKER05552 [Teratosphaeria destructans]|uniref:Uncharacterized protein n=1 Tax=Teratosphaeria destructans TaxID=418781 RepID=A0A9W7SJI0_9PEZI|nr:hypothetical protein Tdes44962_MAKER05552 [Teratosphaeria destructans]